VQRCFFPVGNRIGRNGLRGGIAGNQGLHRAET
jgi:hypothetical protein